MPDEIAGLTREQLTALLRMHVTKRAEARQSISDRFTEIEAERRKVSYANVRITRLLDALCETAAD
jgi:hypothetical protein